MQLSCLKRSVGLVTAATYVIATGILTSVTLGSVKLINNAKVLELEKEMYFYDEANARFVNLYYALPGLMSYSTCIDIPEFSKNCRRQDDINLTTNEYVYKGSKCSATIGCTLQNNGPDGKQAGEDVFRNFLLPMRYLQDAGLGYVKTIGLSKRLFSTENLTKQTWAESKAGDGIYVNIYNYYNVSGFGGYFLFNNNSIMGHTTSSDKAYDHYDKLMEGDNQYLVYHRFGDKRGAVSVQNIKALDIKIDDGKPMTGRLTTYATDNFSGNFAKSEYSKCITAEPSSYEALKSIDYNVDTKTGGGGYCNFTYQLKNVAESVNNHTGVKKVGSYTKKDTYTKCTKYSDEGEVCYKATSCHYEGIKRCCKFEDHSTSCYDPSEACYFEDNKRCCKYGDTTIRCENNDTWEFKNGKCAFKYYDNSIKEEDYISKISNCSSSTSCKPNDNGNKLCNYCRDKLVAGSCVDKKEQYCTKDDNLDNNKCTNSISWESNYYCSFLGNTKTECKGIIDRYCPANNSLLSSCSNSITATTTAYCRFINGNNNNTGYCTKVETKYCPDNNPTNDSKCATSVSIANHYKCTFVAGNRSGNCTDMQETKYCSSKDPSTDTNCTTYPEITDYYKCTFVAGNRSGNCTDMRETKYCPSNHTGMSYTNCSSAGPTIEYRYKCIFFEGYRIGDCTDMVKIKYCSTNNPSTDSGCTTQVGVTNHYRCAFVDGTRSGDCTDMRETKYCSANNPSTDSDCTTSIKTIQDYMCAYYFMNKCRVKVPLYRYNYYECKFITGKRSGNCTDMRETKYCPTDNPSNDSGCATSFSATNHYKCTFVAGTRIGICEEPKKQRIFTHTANLSLCYHSYGCGYTTYIRSDTKAECYQYENISWDDYMPTCTACGYNISRYKEYINSRKSKTVTEITVSCPSGKQIFKE